MIRLQTSLWCIFPIYLSTEGVQETSGPYHEYGENFDKPDTDANKTHLKLKVLLAFIYPNNYENALEYEK